MSSTSFSGHQGAKPRVSIIIPTYNRSAIVPNAIESVLQQTCSDYEVIVVDDGSTDDTRDRLQEYAAGIKYVYQANRGLAGARNAGVNRARGEWLAFLDSDDVWEPTKLERQFEAVASLGPEFGACVTDCKYVGNPAWGSSVFGENGFKTNSEFGPLDNPIRYLGRHAYGTCIQSLMVLRSAFDAVGGFDESLGLAEDRDFIFRISFRTRFCYVSEPLASIDCTAGVPRLSDLFLSRDDCIYVWHELLCKKMLANPEFINPEERQAVQNELVGLYYDWAAARVSDIDFASAWKSIGKIREMGQGYAGIFGMMMSRMGGKLLRSARPRISNC